MDKTNHNHDTIQEKTRLVFLFPARDPHFCSGRGQEELYQKEPIFREAFERCDRLVVRELGWSIHQKMIRMRKNPDEYFEPALVARQIAFSELWRSWNVQPDAYAGICGGEIAAAYAAGVLTLENAMDIACRVSRAIRQRLGLGKGMIVNLSREEAEALHSVAPTTFHIGGELNFKKVFVACETDFFREFFAFLAEKGVEGEIISSEFALHTPIVDSWEKEFTEALQGECFYSGMPPIYSARIAEKLEPAVFDVAHWWNIARSPFWSVTLFRNLIQDHFQTFLQIGNSLEASRCIQEVASILGRSVSVLVSTSPKKTAHIVLNESLNTLESLGYRVPRKAFNIKSFLRNAWSNASIRKNKENTKYNQ